jgi:hypothetical protein
MQTTETSLARKLRVKLENAQDNPIDVTWDPLERRVVTPLVELFYHGRSYQPAIRSSPNKKGDVTYTAPQTFTAEIDGEIVGCWVAGKIQVDLPPVKRGRAADGTRVYQPWPGSMSELIDSNFNDTLVKVQLQHWVQIFPGLDPHEIMPGAIFWAPWSVVQSIGYGIQRPLELVK